MKCFVVIYYGEKGAMQHSATVYAQNESEAMSKVKTVITNAKVDLIREVASLMVVP